MKFRYSNVYLYSFLYKSKLVWVTVHHLQITFQWVHRWSNSKCTWNFIDIKLTRIKYYFAMNNLKHNKTLTSDMTNWVLWYALLLLICQLFVRGCWFFIADIRVYIEVLGQRFALWPCRHFCMFCQVLLPLFAYEWSVKIWKNE